MSDVFHTRVYLTWPTRHVGPGAWECCSATSLNTLLLDALYAPHADQADFPSHLHAMALLARSAPGHADEDKLNELLLVPESAARVLAGLLEFDKYAYDAVHAHRYASGAKTLVEYIQSVVFGRARAKYLEQHVASILALAANADTLPVDTDAQREHNAAVAQTFKKIIDPATPSRCKDRSISSELACKVLVSGAPLTADLYVPVEPTPEAQRTVWAAAAHALALWPGDAQERYARTFAEAYARGEEKRSDATLSLCRIKCAPRGPRGQYSAVFGVCPLANLDAVLSDDDPRIV